MLPAGTAVLRALTFTPNRTTLSADRVLLPTSQGYGGTLLVEATINGTGPWHLLVDSGADGLALTESTAARAGLLRINGAATLQGSVGVVSGGFVLVSQLQSGGLKLEGFVAALVADADMANADAVAQRRIDGVLGMEALKAVVLEMNFAKLQVVAVRPKAARYPSDRAIKYQGENRPWVKFNVEGKTILAEIDTGSVAAFQFERLDTPRWLHPKSKADGRSPVGLGPKVAVRPDKGQLAGEAQLSPVTFVDAPVESGVDNVIGVGALDAWTLVIDQSAHRIYFLGENLRRSWSDQPPPAPKYKLGFFGSVQGTGVRLLEVDQGGAADLAGLRVDDVILTVDGTPAATVDLDRVQELKKDSRRRTLRVRRNEQEFESVMVLGSETGTE